MCSNNVIRCFTMLVGVLLSLNAYGQETIPERVARGASGRFSTIPSGKPPTVTDLLRTTDIVVRGVIGKSRGYLSDDQQDVCTEYEMQDAVILYQAQMPQTARPGIAPPVLVTLVGGEVTIGSTKFTQVEEALPGLEPGVEALFLLQKVDNRYRLAGTYLGVFGIVAGKLKPLTNVQSFAPEYRDRAATEAAAEIVAQARSLRQQLPRTPILPH